MAKTYFRLIQKGLREYNDVPDTWRDDVKQLLEEAGYTVSDDGTVTKS